MVTQVSGGSVWQLPLFIPKGFKLIAVGERCATPTDSIDREALTLKGSHYASQFDPFRVRRLFVGNSVGVAQRSPTAINLNPFGISSDRNSN
jgi:hypothetical protein